MKIYTDKYGNVFKGACPNPFHLDDDSYSPVSDEKFIELGGSIEDDGQLSPFESACSLFRMVCSRIGGFLGVDDFRGGFDEYSEFITSKAYQDNPVLGNALAIQWSAANELLVYEGKKAGYEQPQNWYKCWEFANED